jgi:hypothetical protein
MKKYKTTNRPILWIAGFELGPEIFQKNRAFFSNRRHTEG